MARRAPEDRVLARQAEAVVEDLVDLLPVDAEGERLAESPVEEELPHDRLARREVRVDGHGGGHAGVPQVDAVAGEALVLAEERDLVERQVPRLEIRLARGRLHRDDRPLREDHDEAVDVGKLPAALVHAVEEGVPLRDENLGRRSHRGAPGLERGKIGVVHHVHRVLLVVQRRPVPAPLGARELPERVGIVEGAMELLQVVRRSEEDGRIRAGLVGKEEVIGLGPAEPDRPRVGEGDPGHLPIHPEGGRRPARRELVVVGDVVPPVGEVGAGERRSVRPAMPLPEIEGEASSSLGDLDPLGDVGHEAVVTVEAHQPGVAVHESELHVLQGADEHPEIAPVHRLGVRGQDARVLREGAERAVEADRRPRAWPGRAPPRSGRRWRRVPPRRRARARARSRASRGRSAWRSSGRDGRRFTTGPRVSRGQRNAGAWNDARRRARLAEGMVVYEHRCARRRGRRFCRAARP